jgi:hypothetical protein
MAASTSSRRTNSALAVAALCFSACGSSGYIRVLSVNPPDASVYVNGEKYGKGDSRPFTFDFSQNKRVFIQATHPDYHPAIEEFTEEKVQNMIATKTEVKITLTSR